MKFKAIKNKVRDYLMGLNAFSGYYGDKYVSVVTEINYYDMALQMANWFSNKATL